MIGPHGRGSAAGGGGWPLVAGRVVENHLVA